MLCIVSGSGNPVSDDNSQDKAMVHDRKMTLSMQLFHIINNTLYPGIKFTPEALGEKK